MLYSRRASSHCIGQVSKPYTWLGTGHPPRATGGVARVPLTEPSALTHKRRRENRFSDIQGLDWEKVCIIQLLQ